MTLSFSWFHHISQTIYHIFHELGINPLSTIAFLRGLPLFVTQSVQFYLKSRNSATALPMALPFPCLTDRYMAAGNLSKHYFYVDVGSRIDGWRC